MPELARYVEAQSQGQPEEFEEFLQALKFGLYMHVFPWYAVHKHPESFRALMASDNFNHGVGLKDSEMRCVYAMSQAREQMDTGAEPREGATLRDRVLAHARKWAGQRWQDVELENFWNFTISTLQSTLDFLHNVWIYAQFESVLIVSSDFFEGLSKLPVTLQWIRAALAVARFMSDEEAGECLLVGGKLVAAAVKTHILVRMKPRNTTDQYKALSQVCEKFLKAMMDRYYTPWAESQKEVPFDRPSWMKAIVLLMNAVGKHLIKALGQGSGEIPHELTMKWEDSVRKTLEKTSRGALPERVDFWEGYTGTESGCTCSNNKGQRW